MLEQIAGITTVQKLYLQLLYRCNFDCRHCFHGKNLLKNDKFSMAEVDALLQLFTSTYGTHSLTLLGGEPFLYKDLPKVLALAKQSYNLETAICTNGYKISKLVELIAEDLDILRVSIDGHRAGNDKIRREGSFDEAIKTLQMAHQCNIETSVTATVTSTNVSEIALLADALEKIEVTELKLHELRAVGNAANEPHLFCTEADSEILQDQIDTVHATTNVNILLDSGLDSECVMHDASLTPIQEELERIEVQPSGGMYISCKAVGSDSNAFWFNKKTSVIDYRPAANDELVQNIHQVEYLPLGN